MIEWRGRTLWEPQERGTTALLTSLAAGQKRIAFSSPTGGGKCLGYGTPVLMYDGRTIPVQDVRVGDRLMGPDSKPRTVLSLGRGNDEMMYRVVPTRGEPFTANASHILSLKLTNDGSQQAGRIVNISIRDYLGKNRTFKHCAKLWKTGVDFPYQHIDIDPYFLGVWLGDGNSRTQEFVSVEPEIVTSLHGYASELGCDLVVRQPKNRIAIHTIRRRNGTGKQNPLQAKLRRANLIQNKHIPHEYIANTRSIRLELLAGLLDTDGYRGRPGCLDFVFKSERLARDVAKLCGSLGFRALVRECQKTCVNNGVVGTYYRVFVSGDCEEIPVRVSRKASPARRQIKNPLVSGFTVEEIGVGDYYGFELDGDGLFLLGDFTVTHNTLMMGFVIEHLLNEGKRIVLYSNRRMLLDQTTGVFAKFGIPFGVRASGKDEYADASQPLQLAMIQTEQARKKRRAAYSLAPADVAFVDEAHNQANGECEELLNEHVNAGGSIVGVTATPLGIGHLYSHLVQAGLNSELRKCGAHVKCFVYGPDEPAAALKLKRTKTGEFTEGDVVKAIMSPTIFGRVHEHFERLNPEHKPSILFAPGVKESVWFANEFSKRGVRAAHIDGEHIWIDGETHATSQALKDELASESRAGRLPVVCNRFVLREGIDWPWLAHGILATIFGGLTGYLQSVGRLVRGYPGLDHVTLQDHGGNWWRHGSPNADRHWDLSLDDRKVAELREAALREKKEQEPIHCPKCGAIRMSGPVCVTCGYESSIKSRPVVQEDGTLKEMKGDIFKPRRTDMRTDTEKHWEQMYWRGRNSGMTFAQARGFFFRTHGYMPPDTLPMMPKNQLDWHRKVKAVPKGDLIPKPQVTAAGGLFD